MTPEEYARLAVPCFGPPHCTGNNHDYECDRHDPERFNRAVEQISAALRERDARCLDALRDLVLAIDGGAFGRDPYYHEAQEAVLGPIRALLEEAGK